MKKIRVPSYRLHKPTGLGVVTLSGKDFYLGPYDSPEARQQYLKLLSEWESSSRSQSFGEPNEYLTMAQVALSYLEYAREYYGPDSSEYVNLKLAVKPISSLYADFPARSFGPAEFKACRQWWLTNPDRTRQYVNKQVKRLLRVIKWAVSEGKMRPEAHMACKCVEPLKLGKCRAPESLKVTTVHDDRVTAVLAELSPIVADMVRFQRATGARPGEVCLLKPSMVTRTGDVWKIELTEHKTAYRNKSRTIFVGPKAQAILTKYLLRDKNAYCFSPSESMQWLLRKRELARKTPPSCGNRAGTNRKLRPAKKPGEHYTSASYAQAVRQACCKVFPEPEELEGNGPALKRWRKANWFAPNQLRHNRATEIRAELGLEAASAVLGHSSQVITLIYAEKNEQLAKKSARLSG
jgi:integrase